MSFNAINILWAVSIATALLLFFTVSFILVVIHSKRREIAIKVKQLEELTRSERKYRNLFENSMAGMVRLSSSSWDVLEANHALLEMFGVKTPEEVKKILATIPASDKSRLLDILIHQGTIKDLETSVQRFDKSEVCISFSGSLFPEEEVIEGVIIDVTKRKRLESKHLRTQRMESIGILASGMAHDLKNLLAPVKIATGLLRRKTANQRIKKTLASIGISAEHSLNLVQQVLAFVRGVEGTYVSLYPSDVLRKVLYAVQETLPPHIWIEGTIPNIPFKVHGDEAQLRQVLINLINNARDAMPEGGRLTMTMALAQVDTAMAETITNATEGRFVVWSIKDTGIGIPREKIEKIFEPFFTTKEINKGTGLGLSIVTGIVKGHKGFITVDSAAGKGTTFCVYLPVMNDGQYTSVKKSQRPPP